MAMSYKDVIRQKEIVPYYEKVSILPYNDLIESFEKQEKRAPIQNEDVLSETTYKMMSFMMAIKEQVESKGYMNEFTYKDVADICTKCLTFTPTIEEVSDDDFVEEDEEYLGAF